MIFTLFFFASVLDLGLNKGGIGSPWVVMEQITYLLYIKWLDEQHTVRQKLALRLGQPLENPVFPEGIETDRRRWSVFKNMESKEIFEIVRDEVFPFIRKNSGKDSRFPLNMQDAQLMIPRPELLTKIIDMLDQIPMDQRNVRGAIYEYMVRKLPKEEETQQFPTARHIIRMMVDLIQPKPSDTICDPACGTGGFLVAASQYMYEKHEDLFHDAKLKRHFNNKMFYGVDYDQRMSNIASMNMLLHGVENVQMRHADSLSKDRTDDEELYTVILSNPPFSGAVDIGNCAPNLRNLVETRSSELLFVALFLRLLKPGGRAAVIVPDGVLFGTHKAHKKLRMLLIDTHKLDAVIAIPSGIFKPYSGSSTAVLVFTKTNSGGTDHVWFYDMQADGFSLDEKRTPLDEKTHENNNIPDIVLRWQNRDEEKNRKRTEQSFLVPKAEIVENKYDLSINRYKEIVYEEIEYDPPKVILKELATMEAEIQELEGMLQ